MDVSEIIGGTTHYEVEWKGKRVGFTARTESLTPQLLGSLDKVTDYPKAIAGVVTDWELTANGEKWPLDEESVAKLPVAFLSAMLDKIGESWSGEKKSNANSANG